MIVEVAAAVILRPDGAFLLAQRPAGKVYAGYWEFPGGKVEPGESVESALSRELHEELGVEVEQAYPWITRVFTYPHATVRLRFFRVFSFRNEPHPRENQAIAWQRLDAPMVSPMLPANAPVLASLSLPGEYAITDAGRLGVERMLLLMGERMRRGLKLVQVREPALSAQSRKLFTEETIRLARRHGCRVLAKEPFEGADGIHFTAAELMSLPGEPRREGGLLAASCHTRAELERAMALGLDFAVVGPVLPTASHPGARPLGWENFAKIVKDATLPVYAIGGLKHAALQDAWRAGAHGVAMLSGAWTQEAA